MRGPHNIWRLIRTGATLERTGAMNVVLDAFGGRHVGISVKKNGLPRSGKVSGQRCAPAHFSGV